MNKEKLIFKNSSKVFSIIIIFILLLNSFSTLCFAISSGDTITVVCIMTAEEAIDNWGYAFLADWNGDGSYSYMQSTCFYGWYDGDDLYPAYCLDYGDAGAEEYSNGYDTVVKAYDNDVLYSVLYYGYGYNTATSLGLDHKYDAAIATQYAVWAVTEGWDLDDMIKSTGTTRSDNIVSVMKSIYKKAKNSTVSYEDPDVTISKSGSLTEKTIDGTDYYVQKYTVSSGNTIDSYSITLSNATSNTVIYNSSLSSKITGSTTASSFYVCIPADEIDKERTVRVIINANVETRPVFYLSTTVSGTQNYLTTYEPLETANTLATLSITLPDVTIQKKDRDTGELLEGAEFDIIDLSTGEVVEHVTTGSDGTVTIEDMPVGEYQVVETVAPDGYDLDCDTITFEIEANGEDVTITS